MGFGGRQCKPQNLTFSSFLPADVIVVLGTKKSTPKKKSKKKSACGQCLSSLLPMVR